MIYAMVLCDVIRFSNLNHRNSFSNRPQYEADTLSAGYRESAGRPADLLGPVKSGDLFLTNFRTD